MLERLIFSASRTFHMHNLIHEVPIIAICGSTGTGKSKLAIELAQIFSGEVVNSDAIQLYEGLSVTTNKINLSEACGVPHHLLGVLPIKRSVGWDVHSYRTACLPIIDKIMSMGHLPIITGGTHYYVEAVLWADFLSNRLFAAPGKSVISNEVPSDPTECFTLLQELDPVAASRLHPHDRRKVRKALIQALHGSESVARDNSPLDSDLPSNRPYLPRYPDRSLIFWLDCSFDVLDKRLDNRVDDMLASGLVQELDSFLDACFTESLENEERPTKLSRLFTEAYLSTDDPFARRGILQTIGFKEFADYLAVPKDERHSPEARELLKNAVDRVKVATRQYARRQTKWITRRFLTRPQSGSLPVYRFDVTPVLSSSHETESWERLVLAPACRIVRDFLRNRTDLARFVPPDPARLDTLLAQSPSAPDPCPLRPVSVDNVDGDEPIVCAPCGNREFARRVDYEAHIRGRSHKKRISKLRKRELLNAVETT